jgi:hypothetical protein
MAELKPLVCERCGGAIDRNTMRCHYCDTQYERKHDGVPINFVVDRPGVHRIRAEVRLAEEMARHDPEGATRYAMDRLRHGIADGLLDYMKVCTTKEFDPMNMCQIIRGEVRVIDPTFTDY